MSVNGINPIVIAIGLGWRFINMVKLVNVTIVLFKYEELSEESKNKAFDSHRDFLESIEEIGGDYTEENIKEIVDESININEYWFFISGKMADVVTYTDGHEKSGTREFKFMGEVYKL